MIQSMRMYTSYRHRLTLAYTEHYYRFHVRKEARRNERNAAYNLNLCNSSICLDNQESSVHFST